MKVNFINAMSPIKLIKAINTSFTKSVDSIRTILETEAPNTFLTPISLVRCSAIYVANPNKPRQAIIIANKAKVIATLPTRRS